jgi:type I restriction-modification system DNA methylase subunit
MPEPKAQRQQAVHDLLHGLQGLEPLKKLFWSELNYDRVNQSLSRRGWKEGVSGLLADDPVLFASGADAFHVIYARLASDKLLIGDERPVVSRLLQEHPYALFVFSNSRQEQFHFVNVKYDDDAQKRRLFRRITVGPYEQLRTASERITLLDLADVSPDLFGLSPLTIQQRHDVAFDVEPVTKEFFTEYRRIFEEVEEAITGFGRDKDRKRLYTQRLFNRLMFIAFIQKKGWLKFNGEADYLAALWKAHVKDNSVSDKNFYRDRLKLLFFSALNNPGEVNITGINRGGGLTSIIGDVPYLNGGLFEEEDEDKDEDIKVPDKATGAILNSLFAKFNFTVTESTPLDVEVAVDPEMLGRIFEELVTGRHESGSYYTPKPIVSFMCREALKGYLETNAAGESKSAIERFVETHESNDLHNAETVLDALRRVKVCDPACGSGAYLLGMLHELLDLRAALFQSRRLDSLSVYQRKLEIIQTNVYGVDIDPFAVNIARLRLWLSLAVDFEGTKPEPLPNLDYKVEVGDSLLGPNPSGGLEMGFRKPLIDEFMKAKDEYLRSHEGDKKALKQKVEKLKADIASFSGHKPGQGFDWAVEFAEVFVKGGFDVAIANPPYVRMELFKPIKPMLKENFARVHAERADLYCYFYARSIEMLKPGGMLAFISSNKWLRAAYGANLRHFLAQCSAINSITDFGELPIFQTAATFPMVFITQKEKPQSSFTFTQVQNLHAPYPDVREIIRMEGQKLPSETIDGHTWTLTTGSRAALSVTLERSGISLQEYIGDRLFYGIKTGYNEAFVIDAATRKQLISASAACARVIKPLLLGDDIRKWRVTAYDKWLLYLHHGVDTHGLKPVLDYLRQFRTQLESRATKQEWYELQQPQFKYAAHFDNPKIVFPDIAKESRFTLDTRGAYIGNTGYAIGTGDLFLLGVLNSSIIWEYAKARFTCLGDPDKGGRFRFIFQFVSKIPVPKAGKQDKNAISHLVEACLKAKGEDCNELEREIDARVAKLFGVAAMASGRVK